MLRLLIWGCAFALTHRGDISPGIIVFAVMTPDAQYVIGVYAAVLFGKLFPLKGIIIISLIHYMTMINMMYLKDTYFMIFIKSWR